MNSARQEISASIDVIKDRMAQSADVAIPPVTLEQASRQLRILDEALGAQEVYAKYLRGFPGCHLEVTLPLRVGGSPMTLLVMKVARTEPSDTSDTPQTYQVNPEKVIESIQGLHAGIGELPAGQLPADILLAAEPSLGGPRGDGYTKVRGPYLDWTEPMSFSLRDLRT